MNLFQDRLRCFTGDVLSVAAFARTRFRVDRDGPRSGERSYGSREQ